MSFERVSKGEAVKEVVAELTAAWPRAALRQPDAISRVIIPVMPEVIDFLGHHASIKRALLKLPFVQAVEAAVSLHEYIPDGDPTRTLPGFVVTLRPYNEMQESA